MKIRIDICKSLLNTSNKDLIIKVTFHLGKLL